MAMGALVEPRVMLPVLNPPLFWVAVWRSVSLLRQATVWPTRRLALAGENDIPPWSPRIEMMRSAFPVTGGTVVVVVGLAGADGLEPPPPQLGPSAARIRTRREKRRNRIGSPMIGRRHATRASSRQCRCQTKISGNSPGANELRAQGQPRELPAA